ncbi:hypothetical protein ACFU99_14515 [Streptomyces sp. NPDC057654]|uniref:hypothetical protein n=1 Tax=Streptomyces sp. NPDC057654 TaxID=3346196 RepID=UPI0036C9EA20
MSDTSIPPASLTERVRTVVACLDTWVTDGWDQDEGSTLIKITADPLQGKDPGPVARNVLHALEKAQLALTPSAFTPEKYAETDMATALRDGYLVRVTTTSERIC